MSNMIVGLKERYLVNQNVKPMTGSQGQVYFGVNMNTKEEVAIKLCVLDENEKYFMTLYMEKKQQKIPQQLVNIHEIYSQGQNNQFIIIMEKASHGDLQSFMKQTNYLKQIVNTKQVRLQFLKDIAFGVKELHEMGIIHRDLKPENILVFTNQNQQFTCKICDFGLAKKADNAKTQQIGTPFYMAPELLMGDSTYTKSVDIWALGCLFYELLSEQTLFNGRAIYDLMKSITQSTDSEIEQKIQNGLKDCGMQNMADLIVKMVKRDSNDRIEIKDVITSIYLLKGIQIVKPNNLQKQEVQQHSSSGSSECNSQGNPSGNPSGNASSSKIKIRPKQPQQLEQINIEYQNNFQVDQQGIEQQSSNQTGQHNLIIQQQQKNQQHDEPQNNQTVMEICDGEQIFECNQNHANQDDIHTQLKQEENNQIQYINNKQNDNGNYLMNQFECAQENNNQLIIDDQMKENLNQGVIQKIFGDQHNQRLERFINNIQNKVRPEFIDVKEQVKQLALSDLKWKLDNFKWNI